MCRPTSAPPLSSKAALSVWLSTAARVDERGPRTSQPSEQTSKRSQTDRRPTRGIGGTEHRQGHRRRTETSERWQLALRSQPGDRKRRWFVADHCRIESLRCAPLRWANAQLSEPRQFEPREMQEPGVGPAERRRGHGVADQRQGAQLRQGAERTAERVQQLAAYADRLRSAARPEQHAVVRRPVTCPQGCHSWRVRGSPAKCKKRRGAARTCGEVEVQRQRLHRRHRRKRRLEAARAPGVHRHAGCAGQQATS